MSVIETLIGGMEMNRTRTLAMLEKIETESDPGKLLGWRPGPGRAHIAWQLMHIGVTEELFATERLWPEKAGSFTELWPRFRGGSVPDDIIPNTAEIRQVLTESRIHLLDTLRRFTDDQLSFIAPALKERQLTLHGVLHILAWHEAHHHGQAHITINLFKAQSA